MKLFDTHAHLDALENREEAVARAREIGVVGIVAVSMDYKSNEEVLRLSSEFPSLVYPALGVHPWELATMRDPELNKTLKLIEENITAAVAIGEIGLDYDKSLMKQAPQERQKEVLRLMLQMARRYQKPVIVHSRYAWQDAFALVKESRVEKALFHWFTGFSSVLRDILGEGYFLSATPATEYHLEHRQAIKETPLDRLLLETDSPVVYGKENKYRSQPADVLRSLKAVAALKELDEETLAEHTTENARLFFALEPA